MYLKQFEIRWSDLDANRHVANSKYSDFLNETRMSYMREHGFTQKEFAQFNIGPLIFFEEFHYIQEILPNEIIQVGLELLGNSVDFKYTKFAHYIFNQQKKLCLYSGNFVGWFDLGERKLVAPPLEIGRIFSELSKSEYYEPIPIDISLKNPKIPYTKIIE